MLSPTTLPDYMLRALLAAALTALTTFGLYLARSVLPTPVIALLFLLPVVISTTLGGLTAGILASIGSFLAFNYFFILPYYSFTVHQTQDLLMLGVFLGLAVLVSQLLGRARLSLAAARARERETTALYELSTALAGLRSEAEVARAVAERLAEAVAAAAVEVELQPGAQAAAKAGAKALAQSVRVPAAAPAGGAPPDFSLGLRTARARLGELRVWREARLTSADERLVRTFASQAALALEHVQLDRAETQARILEESDRLKSALLSSVSHELRTPLATITAAASSLRSGRVELASPAQADLLAAIEEEAARLNQLVGNLLDMSRIEAGVLRPNRQWLSLSEVVGGTLARLRRATASHRVRVHVSDDLPLVPADPVQLDQVFTNLIDNSCKYAPPGSTITVRAWQADDQRLQVTVENEGPAVPPEHLGHIFDKFYRAGPNESVTGTGLGLSICKGIIDAHGGRIWVDNLPGGFAFIISLPLSWAGERPPRLPPDPEAT